MSHPVHKLDPKRAGESLRARSRRGTKDPLLLSLVYTRGGAVPFFGGGVASTSGGGGGPNTDYSWSATVSGVAKSAAAGYIAPVIFNNGTTVNTTNYQGGYIFPVTAACTVDMYFERVLGETGAISLTISTFDSTNAVAGINYTALSSATVSFADGEIGWKKVSIPILLIPTGFGLIGISMTGSNAWRPNAWIWMQGTGHVPGATYFQSSNGTLITPGSGTGSGTQGSPYTSLLTAMTAAKGATVSVCYWQQNGTNGHMEWTTAVNPGGPNPNSCGVYLSSFTSPTLANPLILLPDPGNTSVAFMDQGSTAGGSNIVFSNAFGIHFIGNSANTWICGIHFHRCNIDWNAALNANASGNGTNNVVWQCEVDNFSTAQSNGAGVRFDNNTNIIVQDCYLHENYSTEGSTSGPNITNPFTSVPSKLENGAEAFDAVGPSFSHCYVHWQQFGIFNKQNTAGGLGYDIKHCFGDFFGSTAGNGGAPFHFPVQGSSFSNAVVRYSAVDATGSIVNNDLFCGNESGAGSATGFDIYNCVSIHNGGLVGPFYGVNGIRSFNNVSQNSTDNEVKIGASPAAQLLFSGYNLYVNVKNFETSYGAGTLTFAFASWQTQPSGTYLAQANPDATSTSTTTAPPYFNQSGMDYRWSNTNGRAGRPIGVGNEFTGIVNNFLNSNLPVVS